MLAGVIAMRKKPVLFCFLALLIVLFASCGKKENSQRNDFASDLSSVPMNERADVTLSGDFRISKIYTEPETYSSGTAKCRELKLKINYDSTFFGHDAAIDRDLCDYGIAYEPNYFTGKYRVGRFFLADMDGDGKCELLAQNGSAVEIYTYSYAKCFDSLAATVTAGDGAEFCGAADFDADGYNDLLFVSNDGIICIFCYDGTGNFVRNALLSKVDTKNYTVMCGDADGDGYPDIIGLNSKKSCVWLNSGMKDFDIQKSFNILYPDGFSGDFLLCASADMNSDKIADIILLYNNGEKTDIVTLFGRGDSSFGPRNGETGRDYMTRFWSRCTVDISEPSGLAGGTVSADDNIPDITVCGKSELLKSMIMLEQKGNPAYDYSLDLLLMDDGTYRMYSGCRWKDCSTFTKDPDCHPDGDHVMYSWSEDGMNWRRYIDRPMFYLGWETGNSGEWWSDNTLEPEVIYAEGKFHMFWQCTGQTKSGYYGDYIGYASSDDGISWTRKTDRPVITNVEKNLEIGFNHEEVIYVADDPDGMCWWLYTGHFIDNQFKGYIRIRSSDPTSFDWTQRKGVSGVGQIGNQIGYVNDCLGSRLFIRITFTEKEGCTYPVLQISRDGLHFYTPDGLLFATVNQNIDATLRNRNICFLGMATLNGTGEIPAGEDGRFKILYAPTTSATPVAPEIFYAEAGLGVAYIDFEKMQ